MSFKYSGYSDRFESILAIREHISTFFAYTLKNSNLFKKIKVKKIIEKKKFINFCKLSRTLASILQLMNVYQRQKLV